MRLRLSKRVAALINRVNARHLRLKRYGRQREVGITACVGQNLHFLVDATKTSAGGVGQGPVTMNESVPWRSARSLARQTLVFVGEHVSKVFQHERGVRSCVRRINPVM